MAIIESTKHFRPYLFGQKFVIETDHNPLVWLYKIKEPNTRLARWKIKLDEFDFEIVYKKGKENLVADALSRVEVYNNENDNVSTTPQVGEPSNLEEVEESLSQNSKNYHDISSDEDQSDDDTIHSTEEDGGKVIPITESPVNHFNNRVILALGDKFEIKLKKPFKKNHYTVRKRKNAHWQMC